MLSVNEIIQWEKENPRNEKDRKAIRKAITAAITPVLTEHGFVKSVSTFLRLHGDSLLQSNSVCYRSFEQPSLRLLATPLYDFTLDWPRHFQGIRSDGGLEGIIAETAAGIQVQVKSRNSYLAFQSDMESAISKETELLKADTIPRLDRIQTCYDTHALYQHPKPYCGGAVHCFPHPASKREGSAAIH